MKASLNASEGETIMVTSLQSGKGHPPSITHYLDIAKEAEDMQKKLAKFASELKQSKQQESHDKAGAQRLE